MECSGIFGEVRRCSGIFGKVRRSSQNIPVDGSRQARTELALLLLQLAEPQRQSHNSTAFAKASVRLPLHRDATTRRGMEGEVPWLMLMEVLLLWMCLCVSCVGMCWCLLVCCLLLCCVLFRGSGVGLQWSTGSSSSAPCAIRSGSRQLHCASLSWRRLHRPRPPCTSRLSVHRVYSEHASRSRNWGWSRLN